MRLAGPRPWISTLPAALRRGYAVVLLGVLAGTIMLSLALTVRRDSSRNHHSAALTMGDALGLGGLPSLLAPGDLQDSRSVIEENDIVAYYGTPRQPAMGILGEADSDAVAWMLSERAGRFDALNGDRGIVPALHLVYGVAQPESAADGLYMRYVDDRTVRQYLNVSRRYGFALVLDLQIGHSSALAEVRKILSYLAEPDVHVALDPEFALIGRSKPGSAIGSIDADDINAVQSLLSDLVSQHSLPDKLLVVHQFETSMITRADEVQTMAGVNVVLDMDGYGPAPIKEAKYQRYTSAMSAAFGGMKIFLEHDPDPMDERRLLDIEPRPVLFLYQ